MRVASLLSLLAAAFVQFGCVKDNSAGIGPSEKVNGPVFNFETVSTSNLNFSYDTPAGYVVGFEVYAENPFETDGDGQAVLKKGVEPIEKGFTDSKGSYNQPLALPAYVKEIYIYTPYAGVDSRFRVARVENGRISTPVAVGISGTAATGAAAKKSTRAVSVPMNTVQTAYFKPEAYTSQTLTLGKWHMSIDGAVTTLANGEQVKFFGRPADMSYVDKSRFGSDAAGKDALKISGDVMNAIRTALPGDGMGIVDDKFLSSGDIHVSKETELDLIFIQNWGAYHNVLAYYCYDTANPPKSVGDIKFQTIAIANAIEQKFESNVSYMYDIGSMYKGEGVKLKYVDADGAMHDKFPAGVSVGWVLYRDGFDMRKNLAVDPETQKLVRYPAAGYGANYSTPGLTQYPNTAVLKVGDFVVIGFDDGTGDKTKRDYLDLVFNVQASVPSAITDPVPDVDPEDPQPVTVTNQGVLLFEDIWPFQGDFDMNDVVVKYVAGKTKNSKNEIVSAKVDFTIFHSGASLNNTFAYVDDNVANADVTFTGGTGAPAPMIDRTNNIVYVADKLLNYANKAEKVTFTANYTYRTPIPAASYVDAPFNPFILAGGESGKEVHLTEYKPSPEVNMEWFEKRTHDRSNPELGLFYITFENITAKEGEDRGMQLPWAVKIAYDSVEAMDGFRVTQESKPIYKHYLGFTKWVESEGKENTDWYLHYTE